MASGGPGGGNEPPGRGTDAATSWQGCRLCAAVCVALVVHVVGCNRLCELRRCCPARSISLPEDRRVQGPMAPAPLSQYARRPFVTDSLPEQSPVPSDSQSYELTRRFPKRTTSASGVRGS